jgi:Ni,Fe-hydrogenase I small subunit
MRRGERAAEQWAAGGGGEFPRFCGQVAAALGADAGLVPRIAAFLSTLRRMPLVWFQFSPVSPGRDAFATCTNPWAGEMLFAQIPADVGDARPADASGRSWKTLAAALRNCSGRYLCVFEGAVPGGVAGAPGIARMLHVASEVCSNARAVLVVGGHAASGALAAANAAPAITDALGLPAIHVPGQPPSALGFAAALVAHLLARSPLLDGVAPAERPPVHAAS